MFTEPVDWIGFGKRILVWWCHMSSEINFKNKIGFRNIFTYRICLHIFHTIYLTRQVIGYFRRIFAQNWCLVWTFYCTRLPSVSWSRDFAYSIFGAKPLHGPMLPYCQPDYWEQISVKMESRYNDRQLTNAFENIVCEMVAILPRPQCVQDAMACPPMVSEFENANPYDSDAL